MVLWKMAAKIIASLCAIDPAHPVRHEFTPYNVGMMGAYGFNQAQRA